ncbi:MAG: endonuclease/exonuclease/phosphatase family protein [Planctomycetaceae bacterium]|nr:endonuclease/exonuclease/phosphatase family protein [Planctomycetaceae bacterium]
MKVVTWNCNGALRRKTSAIERLDADLLIIQECEDPARSTKQYRDWAGDFLWHGVSKNKGIGVFARSHLTLEPLNWEADGLQSFLPCIVNKSFTLVSVWTKYANSPNFRYIGQLWKYLQKHKEQLADSSFLLCGDLNSNTCWDEWDRWWNHSDVVRELEELGAFSLYHEFFGEEQGAETRPTLYHQKNLTKPYHVDYAFATQTVWKLGTSPVVLGTHDEWLEFSDHMPLLFTINGVRKNGRRDPDDRVAHATSLVSP